MSNNSLSILKNFTRKLANCRYRVLVNSLIDDLNNGGFGYTVRGKKAVDNNDFVIADDFETLLESIRVIFRAPRLHLKKESVVMRAEAASNLTPASLRATFRDEKLWRIKDGTPSPEFVHTHVYEDDFAIYENRFVCYVIDRILEEVSKKINELAKMVETLNKKMGAKRKKSFTPAEYLNFLNAETPVLITDDDVNVKILESLIKSKKWLISLKSTPLYSACLKEGVFNPLGLKPTNLLTKEPTYHNVYNFYLNYLNKDPVLQSEQGMYLGYVTVNLFSAITKLGYQVSEETQKIGVTNAGALRFNNLEFYKDAFKIRLSQQENAVVMTVVAPDGNEGKYIIKVLSKEGAGKIDGFTNVADYVRSFDGVEGVVKTFVVNDIKKCSLPNALYIKPTMADTVETLVNALKTCLLVGEGSAFMYSRYCPVCGSNLIASSLEGYTCSSCKTLYHTFEYNGKGVVWFKNFPLQKD